MIKREGSQLPQTTEIVFSLDGNRQLQFKLSCACQNTNRTAFINKDDNIINDFTNHHTSTGHVNKISTIQFLTEIHRITQPNPYMILLFKYPWEFQGDVLWDILYHIQFTKALCYIIFALLLRLKALLSGL